MAERLSRRALMRAAASVVGAAVLGACGRSRPERARPAREPARGSTTAPGPPGEQSQTLHPTPACDDGGPPTLAQTAGPYFTPNSPERSNLRDGTVSGVKLVLTGSVVDTVCRPVGRALLDFWQADGDGEYDNQGFRLRGHLFASDDGTFRLETVVPGRYPGRTPHLHVKVQPPRGRVLTTQLYFPGEPQNERDGIFRPELLMEVVDAADGKTGAFTFVLER